MSLLRWDSWELPAQAADCFLSEDGFEPKVAPCCATTPDAESPLLRRASSFGKEAQQASEPQPPAQAPVYRPASPPPLWSLLDQPVLNPQNQPTVLPSSCHSLAQLQYGAHSGLGPLLGLCASLCASSQPKCPNSWGGLSMMPHSPAPRRTTPVMPPACCEPTNSAGFSATTSPVHRISYFNAAALGLPVSAVMQHQQAMHRQDSGVEQHVMAASSSPSGACHMLKSGSLLSGITSATLSHTDVLLASDQDEDEDDAKSSLMMVGAKRKAGVALGGAVKKVAPSKRNNGRVVCRNCGAQQTPQWRCGPEGPRTLCNACGVRFKKGLPLPYWEAKKKARVSLL